MNIIFFGTSEFAVESLRALLHSAHSVSLVVTQPDAKKGRRLLLSPPPVKVLAAAHGLSVYQPHDASSAESVSYLKSFAPDLFVVIAYGQILKADALAVPKRFAVNLHGSLLPRYRGAAPTNWAVMKGDSETGVTVIRLNERMDGGDVIAQARSVILNEDTNITLSERLAETGAKLLVETIDRIERGGSIAFVKQDPARVTFAPKLKKGDGLIDWNQPAVVIHNKVRGLLPWPGAYTHVGGKVLKMLKTCPAKTASARTAPDAAPGTVVRVEKGVGLVVRTGDGDLSVSHVQIESGKEMDVDAFLRGHPLSVGTRLA